MRLHEINLYRVDLPLVTPYRLSYRTFELSIFGKIKAGEETLKALEEVATSLKNFQPFFKPLEDVVLRQVIITEQPRKEASGEPGREAAGGAR